MDVRLCGEVRKCVPAFSRALSRKQMERSRMSDMPELPEVETTVRGLAPFLEGQRLVAVTTFRPDLRRSEEHTSELPSLMRISYAVFCLKKKKKHHNTTITT